MNEKPSLVPRATRVGAVSFLNARPLTVGLEQDPSLQLVYAVPSRLGDLLDDGELDVALVPVIDTVQAGRRWSLVSDACIASDGATLTVRVFSRVDPADITTLHVDGDSHTSVALASVLWREKYGRTLRLVPWEATRALDLDDREAVLLIGDKVIRPPVNLDVFSTQIDLGAAWKSLTGLPFVFAAWARVAPEDAPLHEPARIPDILSNRDLRPSRDPESRSDDAHGVPLPEGQGAVHTNDSTREIPPSDLAAKLAAARDRGVAQAAHLAATLGPTMGWPVELATHYLTRSLNFTLTDRHRQGMDLFLQRVQHHGLVRPSAEMVPA